MNLAKNKKNTSLFLATSYVFCLPAFAIDNSSISSDVPWEVEKNSITCNKQPCTDIEKKTTIDAYSVFAGEWQSQPQTLQNNDKMQICFGHYQEPNRPGISDIRDPNTLPLDAEADRSVYQKNGQSLLAGDVVLRQGSRQIEAKEVLFNKQQDIAQVKGPFWLREPGLLIAGDQGNYQIKDGSIQVNNAIYLMHQKPLRGQADKLTKSSNGTIKLNNATYTSCPHNANLWHIKGDSFHLDPAKGYGRAENVTLNIFDTPVFYAPRFYFPIDDKRHSGFLYPTLGYDSDNGLDIAQPYYINLAPNYDLTLTPRLMTERGLLLENELRYMTRQQQGELGAAFLASDNKHDENRNYKEDRWLVNWRHHHEVTDYLNYSINYANASDKDYIDDFGTDLKMASHSPLWQQFQVQFHNETTVAPHRWSLRANFQQAENMLIDADDPYQREPQLTLNGQWHLGGGFSWHYMADYNRFKRDEDWQYKRKYWVDKTHDIEDSIFGPGSEDSITNAIGDRFWVQTGIKYRFENSWSFFEPSVSYRHLNYRLERLGNSYIDNTLQADTGLTKSDILNPESQAPLYVVDTGLFFERETAFADTLFTQTLEPRFKYVYSPYQSNQYLQPNFDSGYSDFSYNTLWRDNRFGGYDRIGDTHHLAIGVTSRFREANGFERFRFGIGQIVYFQDRRVMIDPLLSDETNPDYDLSQEQQRLLDENRAKTSPLATQLTWFMRPDLRLTQDWMFDTQKGSVDEYALNFRYLPKSGSFFEMRYYYRDQVDRFEKDELGNNTGMLTNGDLEEVSGAFVVPLNGSWRTFGRWIYDITNGRNMERILGLTRKSCCHRTQLAYKIWTDPSDPVETADQKSGIFFEFELLGLGSVTGNQVEKFVDSIKPVDF